MIDLLPSLQIGPHRVRYPILQGAMAVRVSGANLAAAVAEAGGVGVISAFGLGLTPHGRSPQGGSFGEATQAALVAELAKARTQSPQGVLGVNVLAAARDYRAIARTAAAAGANVIIIGAGLPLDLPEHLANYPQVALVPMVSNAAAARTLCQTWQQRYQRLPDALIVENCRTIGGHFSQCEHLDDQAQPLQVAIAQVRAALTELDVTLPLIAAGGIWDHSDLRHALALGADGVQIGSRFITTHECDAHPRYKAFHLQAQGQDVMVVPSPVGKPGRALRNAFAERAIAGSLRQEQRCIANCLESCLCRDHRQTYCLLQALAIAAQGDIENGLVFAGAAIKGSDRLLSVAELMTELTRPADLCAHP